MHNPFLRPLTRLRRKCDRMGQIVLQAAEQRLPDFATLILTYTRQLKLAELREARINIRQGRV